MHGRRGGHAFYFDGVVYHVAQKHRVYERTEDIPYQRAQHGNYRHDCQSFPKCSTKTHSPARSVLTSTNTPISETNSGHSKQIRHVFVVADVAIVEPEYRFNHGPEKDGQRKQHPVTDRVKHIEYMNYQT